MPDDPARLSATVTVVDDARRADYSTEFLDYHLVRVLRNIAQTLGHAGFPKDAEQKLRRALIPLLEHTARAEGVDWTVQEAPLGRFGQLLDVDVRVMTGGRSRAELTAGEFAAYVKEANALHAEFIAIRARMHNGEP